MIRAVISDLGGVLTTTLAGSFLLRRRGGARGTLTTSWVRSLASWRAMYRSLGFLFPASMSIGAVGVVLGTIAPGRAWADAIGGALGALAGLNMLVLGCTTYLFNWPKWAVPPHLRHQPGWISEKLGHPVEITEPPKRPPPD